MNLRPVAYPIRVQKTLLVTNDFPPRLGGIQTFLDNYARHLPASDLVVYASTPTRGDKDGKAAAYDAGLPFVVERYPGTMMLPTATVRKKMCQLIAQHQIETVWFGAAAPLGLLAPAARKAGAKRIVSTTHGHEPGWAHLPFARQMLRRVFAYSDVVTYISDFTLGRMRPVLGDTTVAHLPGGISTSQFFPDSTARQLLRRRYGIAPDAPVAVCVSRLVPRKGQDLLMHVWEEVSWQVPGAQLVIVGGGPYERQLRKQWERSPVQNLITLTGPVPFKELPAHYNLGDVFAMPARNRWRGFDVEGLGIVYLEGSACGLPVIAGDSGGAPEAVLPGETGLVVGGLDADALKKALVKLLSDPGERARLGDGGLAWATAQWDWETLTPRLVQVLNGPAHGL